MSPAPKQPRRRRQGEPPETSQRGSVRFTAALTRPERSLVDRAYAEIRRRILDNEYAPAQQVLEQELARELGMSRTPVREALVRLQNENLVQLVPRHGMRVVPMSLDDLRDVYEVLTALELTAIDRLVRARIPAHALTPLDAALDDMDVALERHDTNAWVQADERFHRTLLDLSGNARLAAIAFGMSDLAHRARLATAHLRPSLAQSNREHRTVVDAIRRARARDARARHLEHRARTSGDILAILQQTRLGGV